MRLPQLLFAALVGFSCSLTAAADPLAGVKTIALSHPDGSRLEVGKVTFTEIDADKSSFEIAINPAFEEYFLAMRPFRCATGPQQRLCWFPVKNEAPVISKTDLVPLEYALMFMRSKPAALHLNPFNGVYFKMTLSGERITGVLHDLDMDPFITPDSVPKARRVRPLTDKNLTPGDDRTHWLTRLTIE